MAIQDALVRSSVDGVREELSQARRLAKEARALVRFARKRYLAEVEAADELIPEGTRGWEEAHAVAGYLDGAQAGLGRAISDLTQAPEGLSEQDEAWLHMKDGR